MPRHDYATLLERDFSHRWDDVVFQRGYGVTDKVIYHALRAIREREERRRQEARRRARVRRHRHPVAPLRAAFERSGRTAWEVARATGWLRGNGKADEPRVSILLGLRPVRTGPYTSTRQTVRRAEAITLQRAIGCTPHDVGL